MRKSVLFRIFTLILGAVLVLSLAGGAFGQGKGKGKGKGSNDSRGNTENTNRGNSDKSSDDSLWDGFPDDKNRNRDSKSDRNGSQRFKGLAKRTGYSEAALRNRYEMERKFNPDLTYGQFVAAHMISKNHKGVSTGDILGGLRNGKSIGQVLQDRRWDRRKVDKERKRIRDIFKDDDDYDDRDLDWILR